MKSSVVLTRTKRGTTLPLPYVWRVREVRRGADGSSFVLIANALSGSPRMFNAIRVFENGRARCIGRELPLVMARAVAKREPREDGQPL